MKTKSATNSVTRCWTTDEGLALNPCARWDRAAIDVILGPTGLSGRVAMLADLRAWLATQARRGG